MRLLVLCAFVMTLFSQTLIADTLAKLTGNLRRMQGSASVRASVELQLENVREGRPSEEGRATVLVNASAEGLSVLIPEAEMRRAQSEERSIDPEKPRPTSRALGSLDAVGLSSLIHFAPQLLRDLEEARLVREIPTTLAGAAARLLEIEPKVRISKADAKHLKEARKLLKVWVTPDGVPLRAETTSSFKARFLVISFQGRETETRQFVTFGDRLVVTREESHSEGSGFGEKSNRKSTTIIRLLE